VEVVYYCQRFLIIAPGRCGKIGGTGGNHLLFAKEVPGDAVPGQIKPDISCGTGIQILQR
jgi:hypothetical protein